MRIDSNQPLINQVVADASKPSGKSGKSSAGSSSGSSSDQAGFSVDASSISALEAQALAAPEVRQDRVNALREAIRNGSYKVDAAEIAGAMLREAGR